MLPPDDPGVTVRSAFRIRKRRDAADHPRPLKLVLDSTETRARVLHHAPHLTGSDVWIVRDLSPEDRARQRNAVAELRQRRATGEQGLRIINFRVVRILPRVRWEPVTFQPSIVAT